MRSRLYIISGLLLAWAAAAQAAPQFSDWSPPVATVIGGCPIESRDGNQLYTASNTDGTLDVWAYQRDGRVGAFSHRTKIGSPVSLQTSAAGAPVNDFCPTPLTGNWLMFVSNRPVDGACGGSDIYLARYRVGAPQDDGTLALQSFGDAQHLPCESAGGPNTTGMEFSPSVVTTTEGTFLYFSSNKTGRQKLYRSEMGVDGSWGAGELVQALALGNANVQQPNVSRDGLAIVFASDRDSTGSPCGAIPATGGACDIFVATRDSTATEQWSTPRNLSRELGFVTAALDETRPTLSWDLKRLYYGAAGLVYTGERYPLNTGQ